MQPYTQQLLILYQLETVPVPIVEKIPKQTHTPNSDTETIFSIKYRDIHKHLSSGISYL